MAVSRIGDILREKAWESPNEIWEFFSGDYLLFSSINKPAFIMVGKEVIRINWHHSFFLQGSRMLDEGLLHSLEVLYSFPGEEKFDWESFR